MRFVATKTPEQQSGLMLHRTRHLFIRQQTAVINVIRLILLSSESSLRSDAKVSSTAQRCHRSKRQTSSCGCAIVSQHWGLSCAGSRSRFGVRPHDHGLASIA